MAEPITKQISRKLVLESIVVIGLDKKPKVPNAIETADFLQFADSSGLVHGTQDRIVTVRYHEHTNPENYQEFDWSEYLKMNKAQVIEGKGSVTYSQAR